MFPKIRLKHIDQDATPIRHQGVKWYFFLLFNHFPRFLGLNILTLGCCLSIVLFPAGMSAACRATLMLARGHGGLFWEEYKLEFKDRIIGKFAFWALMMLMPLALAIWARILGLDNHVGEWVLYIGLLLSFAAQAYFFVVAAAMDLPLGSCLTNALGLMVLEWPTTLAFIAALVLMVILGFLLYPYSVVFAVLLFFSCMILFVCQRCLHIFRKRELLLPRSDSKEE